jgi:P4 family phage/plasmid primase-like protien
MYNGTVAFATTNIFDHWRPYLDWAEKHGLWLFPLRAATKLPACKWKTESSLFRENWNLWVAQGYQLAINAAKSGKILLDIDVKDVGRDPAWGCYAEFMKSLGAKPLPSYCQTGSGGWHVMVDRPAGAPDSEDLRGLLIPRKISDVRSLAEGEIDREVISIRNRGYCVAPGSTFGGKPYVLYDLDQPSHECPPGLLDLLKLPVVEYTPKGEAGESDPVDMARLVAVLDAHGGFDTEEDWKLRGLGPIKLALGDTEEARTVAMQITWADVSIAEFEKQWDRWTTVDDGSKKLYRVGSMIHRAKELTGQNFRVGRTTKAMLGDIPPGVEAPVGGGRGMPLIGGGRLPLPRDSEDALALSFAELRADDLRHCEEWGKWLEWNGHVWKTDKTAAVYDAVRKHVRSLATGMHPQDARKIVNAKTVAAVERMARTDRCIATAGDVWDADPWLLNTPGGVVDLQSGHLAPASPDFHMTKSTAVAPGGDCPTWEAFLNRSLGGDAELIGFVQRMLGYALTGDTREHALFFLYGRGGNGKGVLLNTVAAIMGDYQTTAAAETFIDSPHERHPTDLAGLRGARLVTVTETEKGKRWAESKIKALTGGDKVSARFMRQDYFDFVPQFKLIISGNHKPGLRTVDEAIRRRLHLVPFTIDIPPAERDKALPEKLKAEWGGILAWLIEGCLTWQRSGLQPPAAVRDATDEYLSSEDVFGTWLDERCDQDAGHWDSREALFRSWSDWCRVASEFAGSQKQFLETMRKRSFEEGKDKTGTIRGFRGVRVKPAEPSPQLQMPPLPY